MNKLYAFGDSFTWGSELQDVIVNKDTKPSTYTWPALLSNACNLKYKCFAKPGASNQTILRTILSKILNITADDTVVINWTWINRWDFYDLDTNKWNTVRPASNEITKFDQLYYKFFQSELWDKLETLKTIALIHKMLNDNNINFISTIIDKLVIDKKYHAPAYITILQDEIRNDFFNFDDCGFYEWAKNNNFPIGKNNHPLEEAHQSAFEYVLKNYEFTK